MNEYTYIAIGTIIQANKSNFRRIKWEDDTTEGTTLQELKPLKKYQRFQATVTRQHNRKLISIKNVTPLPPLKELTEEESLKLWNNIPTSKNLPDTDFD